MKKNIFLLALLILLIAGGIGYYCYTNKSTAPTYNVIIVAFDGLQAKHLSADGYPLDTTPNLDKFLGESYYFQNTASPSSWTVPTFMSMFTSLYPSEHKVVNKFVTYDAADGQKGVKANLQELAPGAVTLAQIFKKNGYTTAGFTGDAGVSAAFGYGAGFDTYYDQTTFGGLDTSMPKAVDWLKQNKNKKFFMFMHGYDVHGQYAPPDGFDYRYVKQPYDGAYTGSPKEQAALREKGLAGEDLGLSQEDIDFWRAIYDEKINRADAEFGKFMAQLQQMDLMKNTVIVVVSDHGTEFYEHQKFDHGHTLYGELLDVLFAVHLPGQQQEKIITDQVSTLDLAPTLLAALDIGTPYSSQFRGADLTPAFTGQPVAHDVFSETDYRLYTHKRSLQTTDGWKLIMTMETGANELYNLNDDPEEQHNVTADEPQRTYEMEQRILQHVQDMHATGPWPIGCLPVYGDQCQNVGAKTSDASKPNIVMINIDSLRADHMGMYGYDQNTTPFLDSLFRKGVVFDQAIAPAYLTFQTDAAIFSGLYPSQNHVTSWETAVNPNLTLLPKMLHAYGYQTAGFVSPSLYETFGFADQFDSYVMNGNIKNVDTTKTQVADWMKKTSGSFFVFWHIYDVHAPYTRLDYLPATVDYHGPFADPKYTWTWQDQTRTSIIQSNHDTNTAASYTLTDEDIDFLKQAYDSGIRYVDAQLKDFFDTISSEPWYANTVFIITAEHGEDLKDHGFFFHGDIYQDNIRVPLAIIAPQQFPEKRVSQTVSLLDILPTVANLASAVAPAETEGINLAPIITDTTTTDRDIYAERPPFDEYAVISGSWKYILRNPSIDAPAIITAKQYDSFMTTIAKNEGHTGDELYNLAEDPDEQRNLIGQGLAQEITLHAKAVAFQQKMAAAAKANTTLQPISGPETIITYP